MNLTYRRTVKPGLTATSLITAVIRHLVITATFFGLPRGKTAIHFLVKKKPSLTRSPVDTAKCSWPIGDCTNGVPPYNKCYSSRVFKGIDQIQVNHRILSVAHHRFQSLTPNPITTSKPYDRSVLLLYGGS